MSHLGVYGITQSGKSHWVKHSLLPSCTRALVLDVNDEYSQHGRTKEGRPLGPCRERMTARQLAAAPQMLLKPNLSLAVVPDEPMPKHEAALLDLIARLLSKLSQFDHNPGQLTLVLDECGDYAPYCKERLASLATRGATHLGVSLVVIAQRPNLVPATVRGSLDQLQCFRLVEPLDIGALKERTGAIFSQRVSNLPLRKHLSWFATGPTDAASQEPQQPTQGT